jgi:hypothetical protein
MNWRAVPTAFVPMLLQVADNSSSFGKTLVNQNHSFFRTNQTDLDLSADQVSSFAGTLLNLLGRLPTLQSFFPFRFKLLHTAARFSGRPLQAREAVSAPIGAAFEIEDRLHWTWCNNCGPSPLALRRRSSCR